MKIAKPDAVEWMAAKHRFAEFEWSGWCIWCSREFPGSKRAGKGKHAGQWYMRFDDLQAEYDRDRRDAEERTAKIRKRREAGRKSYRTRMAYQEMGLTAGKIEDMAAEYAAHGIDRETAMATIDEFGEDALYILDEAAGIERNVCEYLNSEWDPFAA